MLITLEVERGRGVSSLAAESSVLFVCMFDTLKPAGRTLRMRQEPKKKTKIYPIKMKLGSDNERNGNPSASTM